MISYKPQVITVLKQITLVFVLYTICRIMFVIYNHSYFQGLTTRELIPILFFGLRFDAFSICTLNSLYILLALLPFKFYYQSLYQKILSGLFILINIIGLALNCVDFAYYPFNQKRTSYDAVNLAFGGESEFGKLLPHFLSQYWYVVITFVVLIYILIKFHFKLKKNQELISVDFSSKTLIIQITLFLVLGGLTFLGIRGGLQRIPIMLIDAAPYTKPNFIPIIINTPFSVIKSAELTELKPLDLISKAEQQIYYNPIHIDTTLAHKPQTNVCVIILESFSKEFTGIGNRKSYTPFLDSLMSHSVVYTNAIANGKTSINGIPAVVASFPCFTENHYLNSMYSNNRLQTLPNLLKEKGYTSVFFHGGTNGTMNFNSFAPLAGFDTYFGRTEYNNDADYDGQWGIWDEPFLLRSVKEMTTLKTPFFSTIFTLSSHNPYKVPEKYKGKFPKGDLEIIESIGYADYSLKQFFKEAQKQTWFNNTLFVITADHTAESKDAFYSNLIGQYTVPMVFYYNGMTPKVKTKTVQQIDIMPTILDLIGYEKPYYSFGKSMHGESKQPVVFYASPNFYCVQDSIFYIMNNYNFVEAYNYQKDSLLTKNILNKEKTSELEKFCKAYIQTYVNDVINNKTYYDDKK